VQNKKTTNHFHKLFYFRRLDFFPSPFFFVDFLYSFRKYRHPNPIPSKRFLCYLYFLKQPLALFSIYSLCKRQKKTDTSRTKEPPIHNFLKESSSHCLLASFPSSPHDYNTNKTTPSQLCFNTPCVLVFPLSLTCDILNILYYTVIHCTLLHYIIILLYGFSNYAYI